MWGCSVRFWLTYSMLIQLFFLSLSHSFTIIITHVFTYQITCYLLNLKFSQKIEKNNKVKVISKRDKILVQGASGSSKLARYLEYWQNLLQTALGFSIFDSYFKVRYDISSPFHLDCISEKTLLNRLS